MSPNLGVVDMGRTLEEDGSIQDGLSFNYALKGVLNDKINFILKSNSRIVHCLVSLNMPKAEKVA